MIAAPIDPGAPHPSSNVKSTLPGGGINFKAAAIGVKPLAMPGREVTSVVETKQIPQAAPVLGKGSKTPEPAPRGWQPQGPTSPGDQTPAPSSSGAGASPAPGPINANDAIMPAPGPSAAPIVPATAPLAGGGGGGGPAALPMLDAGPAGGPVPLASASSPTTAKVTAPKWAWIAAGVGVLAVIGVVVAKKRRIL